MTSIFQFIKSVTDVRALGSGSDLNNLSTIADSGLYYVGAGVQNSPQDYVGLIVIGRGGAVYQLAVGASHLYYRAYTGSPASWRKWKRLTGTEI